LCLEQEIDPMNRVQTLAILALSASLTTACAGVRVPRAQTTPKPPSASMWEAPSDLAQRDLFYGPWGADHAPDPDAVYTLVELKHAGVNLGMTVKDDKGREWSVKQPYPGGLDSEAPVEVALSRLLSGIGYHQPAIYFLPAFTLKDDFGTRVEVGGRFRLKDPTLKETAVWNWEDNPFVGTRDYQGLIVLLMMFNSTDLKNTNNSLYEHREGDLVEQWYLTRDVGSALGDFNPISPRKNHPESFEKVPYILGVQNGHVQFAYDSWYKNLVRDRITPDEVVWASDLLGGLSDKQWADAFRAGGYQPAVANRFIAKLREKVEQGRALGSRRATAQER
jgi:hypothetical protein